MAIAWNSVFTAFADEHDTSLTVSYAPGTTIAGIFVIVLTPTHSDDRISGVTFGGDALTRVVSGIDTADEPGGAYLYFVGTSIPAGTQDVVISVAGAVNTQLRGVIGSVTAAADTEIADSDSLSANQTNPQLTLDTGANNAAVVAGVYSGLSDVTSLTALSSQTQIQSDDFGAHVTVSTRRTNIESGTITIGWTAATDDVAMVAAAIKESGLALVPGGGGGFGAISELPISALPGAGDGSATVSPAVIARSVTIPAVTVKGGAVTTPAVTARVATVPAVVVKGAAKAQPAVIARSATVDAPTVKGGAVLTPSVIARSATVPAPVVKGAAKVEPGVIARTATVDQVTIITPGGTTVSPATIARTALVNSVTVKGGAVITPAVTGLTASVHAAVVKGTAKTTPAVVTLTLTLPAPTAQGKATTTPAVISRSATVPAVIVAGAAVTTPATTILVLTLPAASPSNSDFSGVYQEGALILAVQEGQLTVAAHDSRLTVNTQDGRLTVTQQDSGLNVERQG